ncbi:hypothetical protein SAMN02745166_01180 [Prosthecobacter debontii]|uniref:Uncharacterized protein n=1 Tax=Prosthecobacter debontii TaxID=48467 RepID=A0A1T4X7V7_9BACT|nr:hypothetical protein SAMN02745166_01180 [Prosthecobacter debontii]
MSTGHGHFDGALGIALTFHIGKVDVVVSCRSEELRGTARLGSEFDLALQILHHLPQVTHADDVDPRHHTGFRGGSFRHQQSLASACSGLQRDCQQTAHGSQFSIQC